MIICGKKPQWQTEFFTLSIPFRTAESNLMQESFIKETSLMYVFLYFIVINRTWLLQSHLSYNLPKSDSCRRREPLGLINWCNVKISHTHAHMLHMCVVHLPVTQLCSWLGIGTDTTWEDECIERKALTNTETRNRQTYFFPLQELPFLMLRSVVYDMTSTGWVITALQDMCAWSDHSRILWQTQPPSWGCPQGYTPLLRYPSL